MLRHAIRKPLGLRPESSTRVRRGPLAITKKAPRKLASGMKYGTKRHC